jgi:sulfur carrier protein ThiS
MRRDTLELADDSLFIERMKRTFTAADAELVVRAHAFLSEKACADDSTAHKAAALLIEQDADAITVAATLLIPLLWQECIDPSEIREGFGSTVADSTEDPCSPVIPITDDRQLRRRDIHVILSSIGSVPRKALLFITFRLLALQKAIGSCGRRSRKMALDTLWRYKSRPAAEACDHHKTRRMQGLARQHATADSPDAFIRLLHRQVFQGHVVVFGSGGRIVRLDENATVRDYLNIANARISEDALVKVNGRTVALDLTLKDGDSIEVLADGDQPIGGIDTCTNQGNGFDPAGSMHLIKED